MIRCASFRPDQQQTRQGFVTLEVNGLIIRECVLHEHENGKQWISFPASNIAKAGPPRWSALLSFTATVDKPEWQSEAVQAVQEFRNNLPQLMP